MTRTIVAGLDGSPESLAAADWAAREALRRDLPLRLVHAWILEPDQHDDDPAPLIGTDPRRHWAERIPREAAAVLRRRYPDLRLEAVQLSQQPTAALLAAAQDSELLSLGSRGLGAFAGFRVGSDALSVVAPATRPVVLVRAGATPAEEHMADGAGGSSISSPYRDVVLGLDLVEPDEAVLRFAFEAAADRGATLRVVHGWTPPAYLGYSAASLAPGLLDELETQESEALTAALSPWRKKYPDVTVTAASVIGPAAHHLVDASADASLVVIGRRTRAHSPLGPVAHALIHHSRAAVAVVPHA
jgi:nucleotide-binding universal stress UspA family protein